MPSSDTLEFNCPNCQVSLLVPKNQAGVSGPCPHCEASITSPSPISAPLSKKPTQPIPQARQIPPPSEKRPAPLPKKPAPPIKPPEDLDEEEKWTEDDEDKKGNGCWPALLFILFLSIAAYFVLSFLGLVPHWRTIPSKLFPKAHKIEQTPQKPKTKPKEVIPPSPPISITPLVDSDKTDETPDPFNDETANTPRNCLKSFLAASTLEERRPYMTTGSLTEDTLKQSLLSNSFPDYYPPQIETKLSVPKSNYYTVTFKTPLQPGLESITVKVVSPSNTNSPKVDTSFLLDLIQAPVSTLNQNISPEPLSFQAIIEASAYCFDDIPNSDSMARLIFFRNMDTKASPLSTAYLAQNSPIFQRIKEHDASGVRFPGTVTVKWNQEIDPSKPFLEVIALTSSALK